MPISIHGKQYVTVAERVEAAGKDFIELSTEVLYQTPVVIKATVKTTKGTFTGISAANPSKSIEKQSPYEVAETSAVGRALGFAGYGIVEGIASADEMTKSGYSTLHSYPESADIPDEVLNEMFNQDQEVTPQNDVYERSMNQGQKCRKCGAEMVKNPKTGKWFCKEKCWL